MRFSNVATFIASGNVIFESPAAPDEALETRIETALEKELGYDVATFVRSGAEVTRIAACEAYKASELGDAVLYIGLLKEPLAAREKKIVESLQSPVDQLRVDKREIYWRASKSFRDALRRFGTPTPFESWRPYSPKRSVKKIICGPSAAMQLLSVVSPQICSPARAP